MPDGRPRADAAWVLADINAPRGIGAYKIGSERKSDIMAEARTPLRADHEEPRLPLADNSDR
jgi:hypothetical protein